MPNKFSIVNKNVFRGGCPSLNEIPILKDYFGINKIVSLDQRSGDRIHPTCEKLGIKHIILGLGDGNDPKVTELKNDIVPNLEEDGPTYVHCYHGKDRTGMCIAMYRISKGMSLRDALTDAYNFGMGSGLSRSVKHSYYDAVKEFAQNQDNNKADDVVELMRDEPIGPPGSAEIMNSFAPFDGENHSGTFIEVGVRDNSTDYPASFPGSGSGVGGMPAGAGGAVVLPFSGPGQV